MAGVTKQYEVVSIASLNDTQVRLGLAPVGRIVDQSRQGVDPAFRAPVNFEMQVDWDLADAVTIGQIINVNYTKAPAK